MPPTRPPAPSIRPTAQAIRPMAPVTSPTAAVASTNAPAAGTVRPMVPATSPTAAVAPTTGGGAAWTRPVMVAMPPAVAAPPGGVVMARAALPARRSRFPLLQMPTPQLAPPHVEPIVGCPPGLEYLLRVDQLLVHQQLQLLEMFVPFELQNKYVVKNTMSQFIFMAYEQSDCMSRYFCGSVRPFEMSLLDYRSVEVMRLYRPLRCASCLCFCCLQVMEVHSPPGTIIGSIKQECSVIFPYFSLLDSAGNVVLRIHGPFCTSSICCNDVVFDIMTKDGKTKIGQLSKNFNGMLMEAFTDTDNFTVSFPIDLDVKMKATLLGAIFLIDFIFFESSAGGSNMDLPGNILN
ncbi:phospholipid scramblase 2-like isoform X2 [Dermacentor silvarum]|uniref:phospholipid scramblase 2-like isoform X2 n=1 Tax=Dermacentor silvarum TaxID=543639 RepID=UPI002100C84D|nr:phospholipid scramblase 2-like isoform X2 [Dermacentor silvarum]